MSEFKMKNKRKLPSMNQEGRMSPLLIIGTKERLGI